ncbi:MAG: PQQ-binding-like beta-propeller repeat protein [Planctomycetota bacterium]
MTNTRSDETNEPRDTTETSRVLRLWPAVLLVVVQWGARFGLPLVAPDATPIGLLLSLACGLGLTVWWLFASRAPRGERWRVAGAVLVAFGVTFALLDPSLATGAMGLLFPMLAAPTLGLAFVLWAAGTARSAPGPRRLALVLALVVSCGCWALVRTGGFTAGFDNDLAWRWQPSPEDRLLAAGDAGPASGVTPDAPLPAAGEWPGFRGPGRDAVVRGAAIATDWESSPPTELWRRPVGPGWSSFAVAGARVFTQEQRGEEEAVSCHDLATGALLWRHVDTARFWESNGGAGPRATPTYSRGCVYTLGATGIVNALDARDGAVLWSRNAAEETGAKTTGWGFSGSPLVLDDLVVVAAAGALLAYDLESGETRWEGPTSGVGYSSPQLVEIAGAAQIVLQHGEGVSAVAPEDGALLWRHDWPGDPIVQPQVLEGGDLLVSVSDRSGVRRLAIAPDGDGWSATEVWTSIRLKPYFNDFVVHGGHAFGLDRGVLVCIGLEDGKRRWKDGRYGHGQLVLLPDQGLLLVATEDGDVALVDASPDGFTERSRHAAVSGKTWNHPVLVGDVLLVRNAEEMVALRLAPAPPAGG